MNSNQIILAALRKFRNGAGIHKILPYLSERKGYKSSRNALAVALSILKKNGYVDTIGSNHSSIWIATDKYYKPGKAVVFEQGYCMACRKPIIGSSKNEFWKNRKYCGVQCAASETAVKLVAHGAERRKRKPKAKCEVCGVMFQRKSNTINKVCTRECAYTLQKIKAENYRAGIYYKNTGKKYNSIGQSKRRADKFGCYYEPVDMRKALDMLGYQCAACGVDTPKALRGTINNQAPQIDHIIPMAKGGPHVQWNMQVLCRRCNMLKSDSYNNEFILKHIVPRRIGVQQGNAVL